MNDCPRQNPAYRLTLGYVCGPVVFNEMCGMVNDTFVVAQEFAQGAAKLIKNLEKMLEAGDGGA